MKIHLFLVDDHEVVRTGLKMLLSNEEDVDIVGEAGTAREAIEGVGKAKPGCHPDGYRLTGYLRN